MIELKHLTKHFKTPGGMVAALEDIDLTIPDGDIFGIIGMSGAGKSTLVRCINLLERPDQGTVTIDGRQMQTLTPAELRAARRDIAMIFQQFNLLMQRSCLANVCFPMELAGVKKADAEKRARELLQTVGLPDKAGAYPAQLSGGQRQRVAIARALVNNPRVLLLDEPLGALDLQLRRQMQVELKRLQKRLGITFLYITHDQEEALNMSDRIVVMREGLFEQVGSPADVYDRPRTSFVAQFVGSANILRGTARRWKEGLMAMECQGGRVPFDPAGRPVREDGPVTLAVRSEQIRFQKDPGPEDPGIRGTVKEKSFAGGMLRIAFTLPDGTEVVASRHGIDLDIQPGQAASLYWEPRAAVAVDVEGER